jgi:predicted enzyme related to lactoylglutathione lyase
LPLDRNGHVSLPSGQTLYLMEARSVNRGNNEKPIMMFTIEDIQSVHQQLKSNGVNVSEIKHDKTFGSQFLFYDLDENCFGLFELKPEYKS